MKHFTAGGRFAALLLAGLLITPGAALAAAPVEITTVVSPPGDTFGNGTNGDGTGAPASAFSASGYHLIIGTGAVADTANGAYAQSTSSDVTATGNTVTVNDGIIQMRVNGAYAISTTSGISVSATENTININGGTVGTLLGGNASGNTYGGNVQVQDTSGTADGNTVNLNGGTVNGRVVGGMAAARTAVGTRMSANNNTINITNSKGSLDLTNAKLIGGFIGSTVTSEWTNATYSGNALNVKATGITVGGIRNFQSLNFYVPDTLAAGGTMLYLSDNAVANVDGATINVGIDGNASSLEENDSIYLINGGSASGATLSANNINSSSSSDNTVMGIQGVSKVYTFDLSSTVNELIATITHIEGPESGGQIGEQLKSLAEARVSGVGMLTQGADLLATQGLPQLRLNAAHTSGPAMFGVMGGQSLRYNSGSHVDVEGFNLATGLGWNFPLGTEGKNGNLLLGAFFEAGWGSYDSHNSFGNAASVKGDGDTEYYGGGILARYDSPLIGPGNLYTEASFRAGKVETDYSSSDFLNSSFTGKVDYDSSAAYYGAHAGIGYLWNITENSTLDSYTKYLWTRQGSDSVTIEGDSIRFKEMDSHRWRTGAKFSHTLGTESGMLFTPYLGAAYEHEFDSKARATVNGNAIDAPDVKGGTGIGELGFSFKPSAASGFSVDLGMQGYTGKREGVGGSFQFKFEF